LDFISTFLSILGFGRDQANRVSDRRAEVARLNAEVAGEAGRALDLLNAGRARILYHCALNYPQDPELANAVNTAVDAHCSPILQILAQTQDLSAKIGAGGWSTDWDSVLQKMYEWRATASRFVPSVEDVINRLDRTLGNGSN